MYRSTQPRLRGASHRLGHCKWPMRLDICMPSDSAGAFGSLHTLSPPFSGRRADRPALCPSVWPGCMAHMSSADSGRDAPDEASTASFS